MERCDPVKNKCCYQVTVQRTHNGRVEVAEFINRPEHEAQNIQEGFGPGSRTARREGWKVTSFSPMRCVANARDLGRPARRKRQRRR